MSEELEAIIRGAIYIELACLYQKDGYSIPCKERSQVQSSIVREIKARMNSHQHSEELTIPKRQ